MNDWLAEQSNLLERAWRERGELLEALKLHVYNCECDVSSGCHAAKSRALIARIESAK